MYGLSKIRKSNSHNLVYGILREVIYEIVMYKNGVVCFQHFTVTLMHLNFQA